MDVNDVVSSWPEVRLKVGALSAAENDESEPFKSKYEALRMLSEFSAAAEIALVLAPEGSPKSAIVDVIALAHLHQGVLHVQTEENGAGEKALLAGLRWVEDSLVNRLEGAHFSDLAATEACSSAIEACNYLALLYSGWDEPARSLRYLRISKAIFRAITRRFRSLEGVDSKLLTAVRTLDSMYTHALFYYAQIYGKLGATAIAAGYIQQTLLRQLREQSGHSYPIESTAGYSAVEPSGQIQGLDRLEWARNAMRISEYHLSTCNEQGWCAAMHCLSAADIVVSVACAEVMRKGQSETPPVVAGPAAAPAAEPLWKQLPEALQRLLAESAVHWAQIYASVLGAAREQRLAATDGLAEVSSVGSGDGGASTAPLRPLGVVRLAPRAIKSDSGPGADAGEVPPSEMIDLDESDHEGASDEVLATLAAPTGTEAVAVSPESNVSKAASWSKKLPPFAQFIRSAALFVPPGTCSFAPVCLDAGVDGETRSPGRALSGLQSIPLPRNVLNFEAARDVFKAG